MGVPIEAPQAVHAYWANIPNCADIVFLFKSKWMGSIIRVECEGWGQLANDNAATMMAFYHIKNKRPHWNKEYIGWEEVEGPRKGDAPSDFRDQYDKYWKAIDR